MLTNLYQYSTSTNCVQMAVAAIALSICTAAQAHKSGHGPSLEQSGPNGGPLTALVLATEANLGKQAKLQAKAEWKIDPNFVQMQLWHKQHARPIFLPKSQTIKWIFIFKTDRKAKVVSKKLTKSTSQLEYCFQDIDPKNLKMVEVIVEQTDSTKAKQVAAIQI